MPGLLTIVISVQLGVGQKLLTFLLSVLPRRGDRRLSFSAHPVEFGAEVFLGFLVLGFPGFQLLAKVRQ